MDSNSEHPDFETDTLNHFTTTAAHDSVIKRSRIKDEPEATSEFEVECDLFVTFQLEGGEREALGVLRHLQDLAVVGMP